jgi:hypothetical protein
MNEDEGVGLLDGGVDLLEPLGSGGNFLAVQPGLMLVLIQGLLQPVSKFLSLCGNTKSRRPPWCPPEAPGPEST